MRRPILAVPLLLALAVPAAAQTVQIDPAACRYVTRHVPAADVEYKPGVDVQGRQVAPADLGGTPRLKFPERFTTLISIDLARRLGIPPAATATGPAVAAGATAGSAATTGQAATATPPNALAGLEAKAYVGELTVEGDRLYFNGQPIQDDVEQEFAVLCRNWRPGR